MIYRATRRGTGANFPRVSRSNGSHDTKWFMVWGPHKVKLTVVFHNKVLDLTMIYSLRPQGASSVSFAPGSLKPHSGHGDNRLFI